MFHLYLKFVLITPSKEFEYRSLLNRCFQCGRYDHLKEICWMLQGARPEGDQLVKEKTIESSVEALVATKNYGKWMVVGRKTRRNTKKDTSSKERRDKGEFTS